MSRAVEPRVKPGPRLWVFLGGPVSVALGLVLASIALYVTLLVEQTPSEFGWCTFRGSIGTYGTVIPGKTVVYVDEGWSGFPPRDTCSVYLIDAVDRRQPLSAEEELRRSPLPHRLVFRRRVPGNGGYVWVIGLLLAPTATWAAAALGTGVKRRREWRWYSQQP